MWTVFKISNTPPRTRKRPTTTHATKRRAVLDRHVHGVHVKPPEHGLHHTFSVGLDVPRSFREQDTTFLGCKPELVESAVPDFLHVTPVRDDDRDQRGTSMSKHRACSSQFQRHRKVPGNVGAHKRDSVTEILVHELLVERSSHLS